MSFHFKLKNNKLSVYNHQLLYDNYNLKTIPEGKREEKGKEIVDILNAIEKLEKKRDEVISDF